MTYSSIFALLMLGSLTRPASSHPQPFAPSSKLPAPSAGTTCSVGMQFYSCDNGETGCFDHNPCVRQAQRASVFACGNTDHNSSSIFEPVMYNIIPVQPDFSGAPVDYIEVQSQHCEKPFEQVMVFRGIPRDARSCTLKWAQASAADRVFTVRGSGLVALTQLTGLPPDDTPISAKSVAVYEPKDRLFNVDFTSWDQIQIATTHIGGFFECGVEAYFKVAINTLNGDGHVYFEQDAKNGFYVEYSC